MNIKPIKTEQDYQEALTLIEPLFDKELELGSPESDLLEVMALLIEKYENEHHPITPPTPVEAIKFRMEQEGLTVKDLSQAIGQPNRVYEVLNGKRKLTLPMIKKLNHMFNIPLESLIH
ncbi:helix-turn-helix domain-containing protein [Orbaceae bacterium ac157xtp]